MPVIGLIFFLLLGYYIFAVILLYIGLQKATPAANGELYTVSVIVSCHNEEQNIPQLLTALFNQDYPEDLLELILINDSSQDNTLILLNKARAVKKNMKVFTLQDLDKTFAPKKRAIDLGIHNASGDLIIITDADGRPGPQWIRTMAKNFETSTGMVIGYAPYYSSGIISHILALEYFSHAVVAAATAGLGFPLTCVGTNLAYRKSVYRELGGFGKYRYFHSGDDDLFLQRIRDESDWKINYAFQPESHVYNAPPGGFLQFFNQRLRYASKGFLYPWKISILLILAFLFNLQFVILGILGFIIPVFAGLFLVGIVIKVIAEGVLLRCARKKFGLEQRLWILPFLSLLHIPYVVFFALFAQILKFRWAGRTK